MPVVDRRCAAPLRYLELGVRCSLSVLLSPLGDFQMLGVHGAARDVPPKPVVDLVQYVRPLVDGRCVLCVRGRGVRRGLDRGGRPVQVM